MTGVAGGGPLVGGGAGVGSDGGVAGLTRAPTHADERNQNIGATAGTSRLSRAVSRSDVRRTVFRDGRTTRRGNQRMRGLRRTNGVAGRMRAWRAGEIRSSTY